MARLSPTIRRAQSSTRSPSGVKPWNREPRLTSSTPTEASSCLTPAESVVGSRRSYLPPAEMVFAGQRQQEIRAYRSQSYRLGHAGRCVRDLRTRTDPAKVPILTRMQTREISEDSQHQ